MAVFSTAVQGVVTDSLQTNSDVHEVMYVTDVHVHYVQSARNAASCFLFPVLIDSHTQTNTFQLTAEHPLTRLLFVSGSLERLLAGPHYGIQPHGAVCHL